MADNNLRPHIVIINEPAAAIKREYLNGFAQKHPRESYQSHAAKVYKEVDQLKAIFAGSADAGISKTYYRVELPKGHKVSSSEGKQLEKYIRSDIVGSPSENVAHLSTTKESFDDLIAELNKYSNTDNNVGKSKFSTIEGFSQIPFEEKVSERFLLNFANDSEEGEAIIKIFPDLNQEDLGIILSGIKNFLAANNSKVLSMLPGEEGAIITVKSRKEVLRELSDRFVSIQSMDSVDEIMEEMALDGNEIDSKVVVNPNTSNAFACIFDTGVNDIQYLQGSIIEHVYPFQKTGGVVKNGHGTFVASRIAYGDSIEDQLSTGVLSPDVRILSVCLKKFSDIGNPIPTTTEEFIKVVRETVEKWHKQIRVYNISLSCVPTKAGVCPSIKDDFVHPFASEIDALSRKYDVLFVICTGNIPFGGSDPFPTSQYPQYFVDVNSRIMPPGEAMLALTVGSIAHKETSGSMAKKMEPSPFTRRGPGFSGHHKPDLVAHGGNCGANWSNHSFLQVAGLSNNGTTTAYNKGTSFSTPIITRLASKFFELMPTASASLVKAMLIHCSTKSPSTNFNQEDLDRLLGNGWPIVEMLTNSTKNSQTFLYQGEMDYRDMIEIPFYVPSSLIGRKTKNGQSKYSVKISATISFYPETSSVLKSGYCKSHIRTKIVKLDKNKEARAVSFADSNILDSDRYSTVVRLENSFSKGISSGEWRIFIGHESRWTLKNPKTKFAVVVTVEDPKNDPEVDILASIRSECPNKYQNVLQVSNRLKV